MATIKYDPRSIRVSLIRGGKAIHWTDSRYLEGTYSDDPEEHMINYLVRQLLLKPCPTMEIGDTIEVQLLTAE